MKVLVNGGVNLSQLDGWWAEAFRPELGWAIGDAQTHTDETVWDDRDAGALYELLEREVVPQFYSRDAAGIPGAWLARVRASMAQLTPQFSSTRAVREYTERYYLPAAQEWLRRSGDCDQGKGEGGSQVLKWRQRLDGAWAQLRFEKLTVATTDGGIAFDAQLQLAGLAPTDVAVQVYANGVDGAGPQVYDMTLQSAPGTAGNSDGSRAYRAVVPANRPVSDYTARVIPRLAGTAVPLEANHILWQR
jgi:starch phosphorylase